MNDDNYHTYCLLCEGYTGSGADAEPEEHPCECDLSESYEYNKLKAEMGRERRAISRDKCGKGGCTLEPNHAGSHKAACGCLNGCKAWECPNL